MSVNKDEIPLTNLKEILLTKENINKELKSINFIINKNKNREEILKFLYENVISEEDIPTKIINGKSCSIVGSGNILMNKEFGKEIDKSDVVLRFNNSPIEDFEKNCGKKSSISFYNLRYKIQ